jgi:mono/diheme cytochrome c family protein
MRLALLALLAFAACAPKDPPVTAEAGKALFPQAGCASCHKVGAEGSATGPDLTMAGFRHSAEWLELWLSDPQAWKPGTLMPNRRLSGPARRALVLYMVGLKGEAWAKGARPWEDARLKTPEERGRVLYARAGCVACHGFNGRGGFPNHGAVGGFVPALDKVSEGYTKAELIKKIRAGVPKPLPADPNGRPPLIAMPAWGEVLSDAELDAVASYLLTLRPGSGASSDW